MALAHRIANLVAGPRSRQAVGRAMHRSRLPRLPASDQSIVDALERDAFFVTSLEALERFGIAGSSDLLATSAPLVEATRTMTPTSGAKEYAVRASNDQLLNETPTIPLWGLNERLLNIAEAYIGLPIRYRGVNMRRDLADGKQMGTRFWHRDGEDTRIMKIIVYLNDVDKDGGPFVCIPKARTQGMNFEVFDGSRIPDAELDANVPEGGTLCTGPRGTVVFADPCSAIHRGALPISGDRYTLFYAYNSSDPLAPEYCTPNFPPEEVAKLAVLTPRQRDAIGLR